MIAPLSAGQVSPIWHPFTQHATAGPMIEIVRAEGGWLYASDGRRILDAISSWWVNTHGHGHPKIAAAVAEQARTLEQVIFAGFTHPPAERLARKLLALVPGPLEFVFFSDSGSTAVEVGMKMAVGYWHNVGRPRRRVVSLAHGYHGDTFGAMSVGARGVFTAAYRDMLFEVDFLPFPAPGREQRTIEAFAELLRTSGDEIASRNRRPSLACNQAPSPLTISIIGPAMACCVKGCHIGEASAAGNGAIMGPRSLVGGTPTRMPR